VRDFGADGDDEEPDTEAIAKALEAAGKERAAVFFPVHGTSPWHTLIRYNEVQDMWRGSWANAEETYLQHGGANAPYSMPTAAR
jgi:hypothetical protein